MIEQTLRALLADGNVPQDVAETVLERLLDGFSKSGNQPNAADHAWRSFLSDDFRHTQLAGPRVSGLPRAIRVARIMSLETFVRYHVPVAELGLPLSKSIMDSLSGHLSEVPIVGNVTSPLRGVSWACLDDELQESRLENVESGLGLYHLSPGTSLVAVAYTVDSSELHVPTVLDAGFQPGFVTKAVPQGSIPMAWDWEHGRWGLSEMVHRGGVAARDPEVRLLGKTSPHFRFAYDGLASFALPYSAALEDVVAQALRQALAHRDLQPFLSGETSILEITSNEFEHFVGLLFARQGYRTAVTKASRDGGVDVIAFSGLNRGNGLLIQAKHTHGTVGIRVIRELVGARFFADDEFAPYMLVVATTGRFSKPAREAEAQHPTHVQLLDYDNLQRQLRMIKDNGLVDIVHEAVAQSRERA